MSLVCKICHDYGNKGNRQCTDNRQTNTLSSGQIVRAVLQSPNVVNATTDGQSAKHCRHNASTPSPCEKNRNESDKIGPKCGVHNRTTPN